MLFQIKWKRYCSDVKWKRHDTLYKKAIFSHIIMFKIHVKNPQFFNETLKIYKTPYIIYLQFSKATLFVVTCCIIHVMIKFYLTLHITRILSFALIFLFNYKTLEKNMHSTLMSLINVKYLSFYTKQVQFH